MITPTRPTKLRLFVLFVLFFGLVSRAAAASYALIIQLSPLASVAPVVASLGGTLLDTIPGANIYLISTDSIPSPTLATALGVQWMELNGSVTVPGFLTLGLNMPGTTPWDWYKYQPAMMLIRSGDAQAYSRGRGVVIADLNSKVDVGHPSLLGHLTTGRDFVSEGQNGSSALNQSSSSFMDQSSSSFMDQSSSSFMDQFGGSLLDQSSSSFMDGNPAYSHGTLCAGVLAVVAPESMIMPLRVFDDQGSADIFKIAKALRYAADQGAQVVNMSFGTLQNSQALKSSVNYALGRGVVLVASAGNNNTSVPQYPAAFNGVLAVAATDLSDTKASFSNYGAYVYVDAPGTNIFSSYPGGRFSIVSGTSFGAPMVAGTAAVIRSVRATNVAADIAAGAININGKNPNYSNQLGYGRIDVSNAVRGR